jgi:hypothetical protein
MKRPRGGAVGASFIALMCALFASAGWSGTPPAHNFNAYLIEGYGEMAEAAAQNAGNKNRTSFFVERKGLAERGEAVAPAGVEGRALDPSTRREAGFARRQLVERLGNGAREKQPLLAAIAQVNFDCWVAASQTGSSDRDECRRRFYFAFAGLRAKSPAAVQTEPVSGWSAQRAAANPPPARTTVPGTANAAPAEAIDPSAVQRAYATMLRPQTAAVSAPGTAQIGSASPPVAPPSSVAALAEPSDPSAVQRTYATTLRPQFSTPAAPSSAQPVAAAPPVAAQTAAANPWPAAVTAPGAAQIASASPPAAAPSSIAALAEVSDPSVVQRAYATTLRPQPVAAAPPVAAQTAAVVPRPTAVTAPGTAQVASARPAPPSSIAALAEAIDFGAAQSASQEKQQPQAASPGASAAPQPAQDLEAVGHEPSCQGALIAGQCYQIAFTGPAADRLVTQLRTGAEPYANPSYEGGAPQYWYYCQSPNGYYPYVQACSTAWRQVPTAPQMAPPPPPSP